MSLTKAQFKETAKSIGAVLLATTFMVANANAGPNDPIELTCHFKQEDISAVQSKITKDLGMIATTSHFTNVGSDGNDAWAMTTLMRNPETKKGYQWARMPAGHVCITKAYSNVEIYPNIRFDAKAFMDLKTAPQADNKGNGKDFSTTGMNAALISKNQSQQYPMYRATVDDIINIEHKAMTTPTKYVEYLVGNPSTKEGTILAANFNGKMISEYYGVVGTPAANGVKFGAIYAPAVEQMLGLSTSLAAVNKVSTTTSLAALSLEKK